MIGIPLFLFHSSFVVLTGNFSVGGVIRGVLTSENKANEYFAQLQTALELETKKPNDMIRDVDVFVLGVCVSFQHWQSIDKQSKQEPMFANIYILANLLSPALCWNITKSPIWIMHPRKIRGSERNACFVAKCTFQWKCVFRWEMHVSLRKCTFRWKNMRCALLSKNKMIRWFVAK